MDETDDPYGLKEKRQTPIPPGAIFTATSGEYSDFCISGVFRALREIDVDRAMKIYEKKYRTKREDVPDRDGFLAYLIRAEYIEQLEAWELHLGTYGDFRADVDRFEPSDRIVEDV